MKTARKHLSANGLISVIRTSFEEIKPPQELIQRSNSIAATDCLMSAFAMFGLKFPSLLKFDEGRSEKKTQHNLRSLYQVQKMPSDTCMREQCDEVDPADVRKAFKKILACVQRGKGLEEFEFLDKHYLLPGDGTGFFSSHKIHCKNCCVKHHKKCHVKFTTILLDDLSSYKKNTYLLVKTSSTPWALHYITQDHATFEISLNILPDLQEILLDKSRESLSNKDKEKIKEMITAYYRTEHPEEQATYYHNMFCAAIVHPDKKIVLPLAPEPIMKYDGATKNDCERNASKRLYADARREHPHLKFIVVEDSLASNVPHLTDLKALNMRYIVGAKPGDHKFLFDLIKQSKCDEYSHKTDDGTTHCYRYINNLQLNKSNPDFKTNFLEYWETDKNGKEQHFSWVTDITITNENAHKLMQGGRSNWRIENNTFNTLKNQDYHFSHNFGHGYKNLSTVFCMLMMLAFFVDQVQELSCHLFKKARAKFKSRTSLWDKIQRMFNEFFIHSWEDVFNGIAYGCVGHDLTPNTS